MSEGNILVVDDENKVAKEISLTVKEGGFGVEIVNSGKDAIDKLKDNHFDVVLLDIKMPEMSGMEVLKKIKEMKIDTDVIMVTALDEAKLAWEAYENGAANYITKPFNDAEVILRLKVCISERKKKSELDNKFKMFNEIYRKGRELGGAYAERSDRLFKRLSERKDNINNISLEELEKIASS